MVDPKPCLILNEGVGGRHPLRHAGGAHAAAVCVALNARPDERGDLLNSGPVQQAFCRAVRRGDYATAALLAESDAAKQVFNDAVAYGDWAVVTALPTAAGVQLPLEESGAVREHLMGERRSEICRAIGFLIPDNSTMTGYP